MESESGEHAKLAALLAAHKSKKAHDAHLRHAERAELAGRRPDGAREAMARHPKVKMTEGNSLAHTEY
jgi:hypothetical protein